MVPILWHAGRYDVQRDEEFGQQIFIQELLFF